MSEQPSKMVSARLPASLVARVDFVTRNVPGAPENRSLAVFAALQGWTAQQEQELERLGIKAPKK